MILFYGPSWSVMFLHGIYTEAGKKSKLQYVVKNIIAGQRSKKLWTQYVLIFFSCAIF